MSATFAALSLDTFGIWTISCKVAWLLVSPTIGGGGRRVREAFASSPSATGPTASSAQPDRLQRSVHVAADDGADRIVVEAIADQPAADVDEVLGRILQPVDVSNRVEVGPARC